MLGKKKKKKKVSIPIEQQIAQMIPTTKPIVEGPYTDTLVRMPYRIQFEKVREDVSVMSRSWFWISIVVVGALAVKYFLYDKRRR